MKHLLGIAAAGLFWSGAAAFGQTPTAPAPTSLAPPAPLTPPPDGTLAVLRTTRSVDANGNTVVQKQSTYRDPAGVAQDSKTVQTTTAPPPPPAVITTTTTSSATSTVVPH